MCSEMRFVIEKDHESEEKPVIKFKAWVFGSFFFSLSRVGSLVSMMIMINIVTTDRI